MNALKLTVCVGLLLFSLSCQSDSTEGKPCTGQDECGNYTNDYCHVNAGGVYVCRRPAWCLTGLTNTCHRDCTGGCAICTGCGYLGASDTIDCWGDPSLCSSGETCQVIGGSTADGYYVCAP
jgi:hypothetical protein